MPPTIGFHLDEHISNAIADGLRRRGIDVTTTAQVGLSGFSDEDQLAFALSNDRVLVTRDADFLRLHQQRVAHAGIVYSHQSSQSIGETLRGLILIWELLVPGDMRNHVEFL